MASNPKQESGAIRAEFDRYRRAVMPDDASEAQVTECRRAFFAGAAATLALAMEASRAAAGRHENSAAAVKDAATKYMALLDECQRFADVGAL